MTNTVLTTDIWIKKWAALVWYSLFSCQHIYINIIWQNFNYSDYYAVIAPFLMPGRSRYGIFKIRRKTFTVGIGFGLVLVEILDFERQLGID